MSLERRVEVSINLPIILACARYYLFITAILGLPRMSVTTDLVFIALAVFVHVIVSPYVGFRLSYKALNESRQFRPLKRWMVPQGSQELTGHEYREIAHCFSGETARKLKEIQSKNQKLTVFDIANIFLYEKQFGRYKDWKDEDEKLKAEFKIGD